MLQTFLPDLQRNVREEHLPPWLVTWTAVLLDTVVISGLGIGLGVLLTEAAPSFARGFSQMLSPRAAASVGGCYLVLAMLFEVGPRLPATPNLLGSLHALVAAFTCGLIVEILLAGPGSTGTRLVGLLPWLTLSVMAIAGLRRTEAALARRWPQFAVPRRRVALVGNSPGAEQVLDMLLRTHPRTVEVLGYFDDRVTRTGPLSGRLPHLGGVAALIAYAEDAGVSDVYLALPWTAGARIAELVNRMRFLPMTVRLVPDQPLPLAVERQEAARMLLPVLLRPPLTPAGLQLKAAFDFGAALVLLVMLAPVLLIVPVLIRLDSPGPVFFRQMRVGQYGRRFSIFKYRSLHVAQADAEAATLVTAGDRRVTRIGRYLRKYSVDELPQLLNVLRGEMSLVGPRPHAPKAKADGKLYSEVVADYPLRYRVRPGLTGWAQVNGFRGETDTEDKLRGRVAYDFDYIRNWSFGFDLLILLRTIPAALKPPAHNR